MTCTILSVGTELTLGLVLDMNSKAIAEQLTACGIECNFIHVIRDDEHELSEAIRTGLGHSDILIISGGLGPTDDDITRMTVAKTLGLGLVRDTSLDPTSLRFIKKIKSEDIKKRLLRQSYVPQGAVSFKPKVGSASGFALEQGKKWVFAIPGVPREMADMLIKNVIPFLKRLSVIKDPGIIKRVLMATDISETEIECKIEDLACEAEKKNITIGITATPGLIKIILIAKGKSADLLDYFEKSIKEKVGDFIYGIDEPRIGYHLKEALKSGKTKISTAESITGGLIGDMITDVPGSSAYYAGGVVSYSDLSKKRVLGISMQTLEQEGAVSSKTCLEMSQSVKKMFGSDYSLAVAGYAGPKDPETGLVYLSIIGKRNEPELIKRRFLGTRDDIKFRTAQLALNRLRVMIINE